MIIETSNGPVSVLMNPATLTRNLEQHFRREYGSLLPQAGNFCRDNWHHPSDVIEEIKDELAEEIIEAIARGPGKDRVEIDFFDGPIGWRNNQPLNSEHLREFEFFRPNNKWCGLRYKRNSAIKAPLTDRLTIDYCLELTSDGFRMRIDWMTPGPDVEERAGDVTATEGLVVMHWGHPGVPLAV